MIETLTTALGTGVTLLLVSVVAGVALVYAFQFVSFQRGIAGVKRRIGASLLESVVFRRETPVALRAQGRTFLAGVQYLAITLPSFVILGFPCVYLLSHLYPHLGVAPVSAGSAAIVEVRTEQAEALFKMRLAAEPPTIISPPVRIPSSSEGWWRVQSPERGAHRLTLTLNNEATSIPLQVGADGPIYPTVERGFWGAFLYPSPFTLPPGVASLNIRYPERSYRAFGIEWNWLVVFFVVSLASGFAAAKVLKIQL